MERKNNQLTFLDNVTSDLGGKRTAAFFAKLISDEEHSVFANSAYIRSDRKKALEAKGIFCGIIQRRVRGQKELTPEQKWHNRLAAGFRAAVEHPLAWMKNTGYRRARYRGLRRNVMDFALHAIAYNFKRSFSLQEAVA